MTAKSEPSWLIDYDRYDSTCQSEICNLMTIGHLMDRKVLVPDTRLQAIADAWNAETSLPEQAFIVRALRRQNPELASALDALTEENPE